MAIPQLPHLPEVERLSSRVIRILGGNPGKFTLQGTNTYLLGTGPTRLLIDTAAGHPSWLASLHRTLEAEKCTISDAILTHWHEDHTGGVSDLRGLVKGVRVWKMRRGEVEEDGLVDVRNLEDGRIFSEEGVTVRVVSCPGHTTDHIALVLAEENAMFTGDNVLGHGTAVFEDLSLYLNSLEKMRRIWLETGAGGGRAYPGHGAVVEDGVGRIGEYIAHRKEREDEVLEILKGGGLKGERDDGGGWTPGELVKIIYRDVPEALHAPAERGVRLVLGKLREEGRVDEVASGRWRLKEKEREKL